MTSLQLLDLSFGVNHGLVMEGNFKNLCSLEILDLTDNGMNGDITVLMDILSQWGWEILKELHLYSNNFTGTLPSFIGRFTRMIVLDISNNNITGIIPPELSNCTCLTTLDLSNNQLSGIVPTGIGAFTNLTLLDLSRNNFSGVISEEHFSGLINLKKLDLSSNSLELVVDTDWIPPFSLKVALLASCQMGHLFPAWLQWQLEITKLDFSSTSLMDKIPDWFWDTFSHTIYMDISDNQLSGSLPAHLIDMAFVELNMIDLDLSSNLLLGEIPPCFGQSIEFLLSNNSLSGEFPAFLQKCTSLSFLDFAWNNFSGRLPEWIGELTSIQLLRLSHNTFSGSIPTKITNLRYLQYLDLSSNRLSGVMPSYLSNLTAMTLKGSRFLSGSAVTLSDGDGNNVAGVTIASQFGQIVPIITKGQQLEYGSTLAYFVSIDLSANSLTESLDLSWNNLFGEIPSSMSNLTSLSYFNLSYNNLYGRIPSGRQLDTINVDNPTLMYISNNGLCGTPLPNNCSGNNSLIDGYHNSSKHKLELMSFNIGLILGFVVGLWMAFCALLFMKTWRITYYRLVDNLCNGVYVFVVVKWASLTRSAAAE
ncbi:hypothetical protein PVAP13_6NG104106 [Panicum virgatum]|uniref:Uncharacterized protein n=1 Tax=Panicum virgatum TaxID=38727 RepID=A0A8T0QX86_PANVG|nr:hypothetical protein PVAP13_6NG104106 [Panicum virgatum]